MICETVPVDGSKEAYEFAAEVLELDLADFGFRLSEDGSVYEYFEQDDGMDESPYERFITIPPV